MTRPIGSSERERWRGAFAAARDVFGDGSRCPPAERLWASARETLDPADNEELILHLARCPACAEGWRLAREACDAPPAPRKGRPLRFRSSMLAAAVAVLLFGAVGLGLRLGWFGEAPSGTYRNPQGWRIVTEIPTGTPVSRDDCVLRWTAGPPGTTYDVRVGTQTLEPVLEVWRLSENEVRIEPSRLRDLPPGTVLLWRVTAHPPDGPPSSSPTFRTRLGPPE